MTSICFFLFFCIWNLHSENQGNPLSVVIIGGGPAGLATAIEAHALGADVTIIEKRDVYIRIQRLFLTDSTINLLEKWGVSVPEMQVTDIGMGKRDGFVKIKYLEQGLENRVKELGIKKIQGEFMGIKGEEKILIYAQEEANEFSYDILVAADGAHSRVRDSLGIRPRCFGTAKAALAFIECEDFHGEDNQELVKKNDLYTVRISVPSLRIIFVQAFTNSFKSGQRISLKKLEQTTRECGWLQEADCILEGKAETSLDIEVRLQQARAFSDEKRSAIVIGDAAASASFFLGNGVNTAFLTVALAGDFFKRVLEQDGDAYPIFNQMMQETTDKLINESRHLFHSDYTPPN